MSFIVLMFLFTAVCGVFDSKIRTSGDEPKCLQVIFRVAAAVKTKTP